MPFLFPYAGWLAVVTSTVMLILLASLRDLGARSAIVLVGCLLLAGYVQFFAASPIVAVLGLVLQTMLAIYLIVRWRLTA